MYKLINYNCLYFSEFKHKWKFKMRIYINYITLNFFLNLLSTNFYAFFRGQYNFIHQKWKQKWEHFKYIYNRKPPKIYWKFYHILAQKYSSQKYFLQFYIFSVLFHYLEKCTSQIWKLPFQWNCTLCFESKMIDQGQRC